MPLLMQSAVLLKQRYKSDTLRHSLLETAQNAIINWRRMYKVLSAYVYVS